MKKNIAILINTLKFGGAEKVAIQLANELTREFNVSIVLLSNEIEFNIINESIKMEYLTLKSSNRNNYLKFFDLFKYAYSYKKYCNNHQIEKSISILTRSNFVAIISKSFGNKSSIIISEHSFLSKQYGAKSLKSYLNKILVKNLYSFADKIVAVSNGVKNDLIKNFKITNNIDVVYNPIDINQIEKLSLEKINDDINFNKFTYITVGRLEKNKNHKLLIEAFSKLTFDAQLLVIGDGECMNDLKEQIKNSNLENKVIMLGSQLNPYKFLIKSHCFVFSSNFESFGIVLVEALACNLPIVSTDCVCGPREILSIKTLKKQYELETVQMHEYGILVPVNSVTKMIEAMEIVFFENETRKNYINKARIRINKFNINTYSKGYIK